MDLRGVKVTWLGHSTFILQTPEGKRLLVDPWLAGNPKCPKNFHTTVSDAILVTHGHMDHIGDLITAQKSCEGPVVAIWELNHWLRTKHGVPQTKLISMNKGGTAALEGMNVSVSMTDARHSSAWTDDNGDIVYLGEAAGFVVKFSNDLKLYIAGDTCAFGDMSIISELWQPDVAILPIGDLFTMDPKGAALAARLLGVRSIIPCHYGTFPGLGGTVDELKIYLSENSIQFDQEVIELQPGETVG